MAITAFFTICANNYLHYALTLAKALERSNPDIRLFVFIVDRDHEGLYDPLPPDSVINVNALALPRWNELAFKYDILELSTAVKPSCIKYLFANKNVEAAIYLDPDIWVMKSLSAIFSLLQTEKSAVLTPHICRPIDDNKFPQDIDILRAGTFNLGFCGFSARNEAIAFLDWWEEKLARFCYSDVRNGLFVDQRWCDFAPSFLPNLHISHDPGYNLAYWNLHERPLEKIGGEFFIGESPLSFVHFSGIDPALPEQFSKYQNRFTRADLGALIEIYDDYLLSLQDSRNAFFTDPSAIPYVFSKNKMGEDIDPSHRYAYRLRLNEFGTEDPFSLELSELESSGHSPQIDYLLRVMTSRGKTLSNFLKVWLEGPEKRRKYWVKKFHSRGIRFPAP